jgi:hypothetical protein
MSELSCPKLQRFDAPLLHRWLQLPPEHAGLIDATAEPSQLLGALRDRQLWPEAMRLLAYGLPEREAVWWSCMCVRHSGPAMPDSERAAVAASETWVRRPGPETRRQAALALVAAGYGVPGAGCAFGTIWSHRKRFLPDLCGGRGAAMAVSRAASRDTTEPRHIQRRHLTFFESGLNIGNGGAGHLAAESPATPRAA